MCRKTVQRIFPGIATQKFGVLPIIFISYNMDMTEIKA